MNGHVVSSFQPPFICKTSSGGTNAEGWFKSSLGSMTERGMRGCSVIVNRLIDNVFWLSCKDERKKRNDQLSEGDSIFPYIKNMPSFLKKMVMFLRNITIFLENIKVFFAAWECVKTKPRPYEPKDSIVHVLTHPPVCKVCTYASGYTYGGISPHVYTYRTTRTHA